MFNKLEFFIIPWYGVLVVALVCGLFSGMFISVGIKNNDGTVLTEEVCTVSNKSLKIVCPTIDPPALKSTQLEEYSLNHLVNRMPYKLFCEVRDFKVLGYSVGHQRTCELEFKAREV